jgi:hypothetical protein
MPSSIHAATARPFTSPERAGHHCACARSATRCASCTTRSAAVAEHARPFRATAAATPIDDVLRERGRALDGRVRASMESRFGHDFSRVRVHADDRAAHAAAALDARAWTLGDHLVFGRGQYAPGRRDGDWLLAHELAHVVQQTGTPLALHRGSAATTAAGADPLEHEASAAAAAVVAGRDVTVSAGHATPGIQRALSESEQHRPPTVPCGMERDTFVKKVAYHAARHQINPWLSTDPDVTITCENPPPPCHVTFSRKPVTVAVRWRVGVDWVVAGWDLPDGSRKACRWRYRCEERDIVIEPNADECRVEAAGAAPPGAPAPPGAHDPVAGLLGSSDVA